MTPSAGLRLSMLGIALLMSLSIPVAAAQTQRVNASAIRGPLVLKTLGSFYIGGRTEHTRALTGLKTGGPFPPNSGEISVGQMYVQYAIPQHGHHVPLVMIHGGVLTGAEYETTPDGRMGWQEYFLRRGRAVYLVDQVARGRSGFDPALINEVRLGLRPPADLPPIVRIAQTTLWTWLRFGPAPGTAYRDEQFPVSAVEQFYSEEVPEFAPAPNALSPTPPLLAALVGRIGGAVLLGHSESAFFPERAALIDPSHVRAMITLESAFCPASFTANQVAVLRKIPLLIIFGDHLADGPPKLASAWTASFGKCQTLVRQIRAAGGDATLLHLPALGIHGNSHMMMQDRNNLQVADLILGWIAHHVETRH